MFETGDYDDERITVSLPYERLKFVPGARKKGFRMLAAVMIAAVASEAVLSMAIHQKLILVYLLADFLILIFGGFAILNHLIMTRPRKAIDVVLPLSFLSLFAVVFIPLYILLDYLNGMGYSFVFSGYFTMILQFCVFLSISVFSATWRWARLFLRIRLFPDIRITLNNAENSFASSVGTYPENTEGLMKKYISGRMTEQEFKQRLNCDGKKAAILLSVARTLLAEIRSTYRL